MSVDNLEDIKYNKQYIFAPESHSVTLHDDSYKINLHASLENPIMVTVCSNEILSNKGKDILNPWIYMKIEGYVVEFEMQWELFKNYASLVEVPVNIKLRTRLELLDL